MKYGLATEDLAGRAAAQKSMADKLCCILSLWKNDDVMPPRLPFLVSSLEKEAHFSNNRPISTWIDHALQLAFRGAVISSRCSSLFFP